jgi:hypothetical protein
MPEPLPRASVPPPMWPATLPNPQADSLSVTGPPRVERFDPLAGPTRLRVRARTATMGFGFTCFFTQQQMQDFETWYTSVARDHDGEFYARWVGGSRVVAFIEPYAYRALGRGYVLDGQLVRTRIDPTACDEFISSVFGAIYRDDGLAPDIYKADLSAVDIYADDFDLGLIVRNEC